MNIYFDFETVSDVDLIKQGSFAYAEHKSTEVYSACFYDPTTNKIFVFCSGKLDESKLTKYNNVDIVYINQRRKLSEYLSTTCNYVAHNAFLFDLPIWNYAFTKLSFVDFIPKSTQIIDTFNMACACNLPGSLHELSKIASPIEKIDGKELIKLLTKYKKLPITANHKLIEYNIVDCISLYHVHNYLNKYNYWDKFNDIVQLNNKINQNGVKIDVNKTQILIDDNCKYTATLIMYMQSLGVSLTCLRSPKQLLQLLNDNGLIVPNCKEETLKNLLDNLETNNDYSTA